MQYHRFIHDRVPAPEGLINVALILLFIHHPYGA